MNQKEIGGFITCCRKEKNMTQVQLAEILNVSDKSVSRWENGKTMMDLSLFEPLCKALDITVSELLYARRMSIDEINQQGELSAMQILATKAQLETLGIFTEVLIVVGIIISITLTKMLAVTNMEMVITLLSGCFVWGFGIILRVKIKKAILKL